MALLQEAGPPPGALTHLAPVEDDVFWGRLLYDRWCLVVPLSEQVEVARFRQVAPVSGLAQDEIGVSGIAFMNPSKHRILASGDLNMSYGATGHTLSMPQRERTVWDRFAAMGLDFLGPQAPNGRQAATLPTDVPADTSHGHAFFVLVQSFTFFYFVLPPAN